MRRECRERLWKGRLLGARIDGDLGSTRVGLGNTRDARWRRREAWVHGYDRLAGIYFRFHFLGFRFWAARNLLWYYFWLRYYVRLARPVWLRNFGLFGNFRIHGNFRLRDRSRSRRTNLGSLKCA